jgi:Reverse transcriptase (RNA-dependent DNA polymerase)
MAPGHESLPASVLLQPQRSAHVQSPPCAMHDLQADKGIMLVCGLQSPDPPAEDAKGAGGACATAVGTPELPGDAEEAGGVPAAVVEMPELPEDVEEAGGAQATVIDMSEPPEDPEGPENMLTAETVDTGALEACTPTEAQYTARPVAQDFSQIGGINLDDPIAPVARLESSCTVISMANSPQLELQQTGIGDTYLNDVLNKSEAVLSMQHQLSHKSHDLGTHILHTVKANALCCLKPSGRLWQHQIISQFLPSIRVQQVSAGPGPYPQVVLLQTEPEALSHQSMSHLDSSPTKLSIPHIPTPKDNPVIPSPSIDHRATPISSGNDHHHRCELIARLNAQLVPHLFVCPEIPPYHIHIDAPLHWTCWVAEQCTLHPAHWLADDTLANAIIKVLTLYKSSISLLAPDHAQNEGECCT